MKDYNVYYYISPPHLFPRLQSVIIQQPGENGQSSSQVVRVTSRSGKPVTPEDITKIVSSLPKLKSGSKIIVNSGPNMPASADGKVSISIY